MASSRLLDRNVKPQRISNYDRNENDEFGEETADIVSNYGDEEIAERSLSEDADDQYGFGGEVGAEGGDIDHEISGVSFGALLQAQDAISRKRKRGSDTTADQDAKLHAIRTRLEEIRSQKALRQDVDTSTYGMIRNDGTSQMKHPSGSMHSSNGDKSRTYPSVEAESDSDSAPSEEEAPTKSRSSKHAPTSQSSKYQVTRKRIVIDVPKRVSRDPRFDALNERSAHPGNSEKAYGFLRDYQKSEISELKAAIKNARNDDDKETLKRKIVSMENRLKSKEAKEREQEVLRQHRKEEKGKVEQGKKPFFLKKKDLKEKAQVERFKGMKKKDQEKLIEKRRRKESQKEKKRMPEARRLAG